MPKPLCQSAVPIGLLGTLVWYARMTYGSIFVHVADHYIEEGQYHKIWRANVLYPQLLTALITIIPCGLAAYYGASYISDSWALGGTVLTIFKVIGGMMPALGGCDHPAIYLQRRFAGLLVHRVCSRNIFWLGLSHLGYRCFGGSCLCSGDKESGSVRRRRLAKE